MGRYVINIHDLEELFLKFSNSVPLVWYTLIGSFIEEIIGIIPSPLVLTVAGSVAVTKGEGVVYLLFLGLLAALGKTLASWLLYFVADKAEDVVIGKFGPWIGVSHTAVEAMGKRFGKGKRDDIVIFLSRAIPIVPSTVVSIVCGAVRIDIKTYLLATFLGSYVRSMLYIYLGYIGLDKANNIITSIDDLGFWMRPALFLVIICVLGWVAYRRIKMSSKE